MPVGTATTIGYEDEGVAAQITLHRIWTDATPQFQPANTGNPPLTFGEAMSRILSLSDLPPNEKLTWLGVDLTLVNDGQESILLGSSDRDTPTLNFGINGANSNLAITGFSMGTPGCPFPFSASIQGEVAPGQSVSGCVALAVPAGSPVSTVGFVLDYSERGPEKTVLWSVPSQ